MKLRAAVSLRRKLSLAYSKFTERVPDSWGEGLQWGSHQDETSPAIFLPMQSNCLAGEKPYTYTTTLLNPMPDKEDKMLKTKPKNKPPNSPIVPESFLHHPIIVAKVKVHCKSKPNFMVISARPDK